MSLRGLRVAVTRTSRPGDGLVAHLSDAGARVLWIPTIAVSPPESWAELDDSIRELAQGRFEWVAFTSCNGVERFFSRLGCMPEEAFKGAKVAAVGSATERCLAEKGIDPDLVPATFTAEALAEALGEGGGRVLLPRAESVPPTMVEMLEARGWQPHEVVAYRTESVVPRGPDADAVAAGEFDVVTFTSASTVAGFVAAFDAAALGLARDRPSDRLVACIGPVTAQRCGELGLRVDVVADPHTAEGLVTAIGAAAAH